jgi:hypothetical protein
MEYESRTITGPQAISIVYGSHQEFIFSSGIRANKKAPRAIRYEFP